MPSFFKRQVLVKFSFGLKSVPSSTVSLINFAWLQGSGVFVGGLSGVFIGEVVIVGICTAPLLSASDCTTSSVWATAVCSYSSSLSPPPVSEHEIITIMAAIQAQVNFNLSFILISPLWPFL